MEGSRTGCPTFLSKFIVIGVDEERVVKLAVYMPETGATVRAVAKHFGVSKSTVQTVVTKTNGLSGR